MLKRRRTNDATAPRKKKLAPVFRYDCLTCSESKHEKYFPDYNPTEDCEHFINTCSACLQRYVDEQIENANIKMDGEDNKTFGIQCPECPRLMKAIDIEIATSEKMSARYNHLERVYISNNTPEWRWCLSPSCDAGQIHNSAPDKDGESDLTDMCQCHKCKARACVPCDRPSHENESCEAYQLRIKDGIEEEDEALRVIASTTRPCPYCRTRIQKHGGCDNMCCTACLKHSSWTDGKRYSAPPGRYSAPPNVRSRGQMMPRLGPRS